MRDGHGAFRTVRRAAFAAVLVLASAALAGSPGDLEWAEIASTASSGSEGRAVATFSDGSFVVTGKLSGNPYDLWVVRYGFGFCSCGRMMFSPTLVPLPSRAPRFAASMIPGPPPVTTA